MGWFRRRRQETSVPDLRGPAPSIAKDIGAGLWSRSGGPWEVVRVLHDPAADLYYLDTGENYVYGANVGGYGRRELATLYISGKLNLSPELIAERGEEPAVILNVHGDPVLAAPDWSDGVDPLIADPAFHADELPR